jgi:hypothetical protein
LIAALVAAFVSVFLYTRETPPQPWESLARQSPRFDARRAFEDVRALATGCSARVTGSEGGRCAADFIERRFRDLGLATRVQRFSLWLRGERVNGRNVFAVARGNSTRSVLVVAHYDASATSPEAAADNATGAATLLEIARLLASESRPRTLIFLASDASTWGMIGADRFAAAEAWKSILGEEASAPFAAISLDHVVPGTATGVALQGTGQFAPPTPLWLRAKVALGIAAAGLRVFPERLPAQIVARAVPIPFTDQGPLLRRGIPAINLATRAARPGEARRALHTAADRFDGIQPGALRLFGSAAESGVRVVMEAGRTSSPDILTVSADKTIPATAVRAIAALLFLPLLALTGHAILRLRGGGRAAARLLAWGLPAVAAALALRAAVWADLLPRFALYPAAPKDPFLTTWMPAPWLAALAAAGVGAWVARRASRGVRDGRREGALLLLCLASAWAWARNDLTAAVFLAPAAWLWPWMGVLRGIKGRAFDSLLLLGGAAPLITLAVAGGKHLFLGPWILGYAALQFAYGVFTLHAAAIAGLAAAAGLLLFSAPRTGPGGRAGNT